VGLQATLTSQAEVDALPEAVRALYVPKDGRFALDVIGVVPESDANATRLKLAEFRDNNIRLLKEQDEAKARFAKFDGIDPEEFKALKAEKDKLAKRGVKTDEDLGAIIQKAIADATKPLGEKLALIEADREKLKRDLDATALREAIAAVGTKKGVKTKALSYVVDKARELFRVVDGKVLAADGVFSPVHPTDPLTPDEWLDALAKTDDFLFEPNTGGGAAGSSSVNGPLPRHTGPFKTSGGGEVKTDGITVL
jgi:hypothetical protein